MCSTFLEPSNLVSHLNLNQSHNACMSNLCLSKYFTIELGLVLVIFAEYDAEFKMTIYLIVYKY